MREFVTGRLERVRGDRTDRDTAASRESLTVAIEMLEGSLSDVERSQRPAAVPCRCGRRRVRLAVRLRECEPVAAKHEAGEGRLIGRRAAGIVGVLDRAVARYGHTELDRLL